MLIKIYKNGYLVKVLEEKKQLEKLPKEFDGCEYKVEDQGKEEFGIIKINEEKLEDGRKKKISD